MNHNCICDARFSGSDDGEWAARGAPSCYCREYPTATLQPEDLEAALQAANKLLGPGCGGPLLFRNAQDLQHRLVAYGYLQALVEIQAAPPKIMFVGDFHDPGSIAWEHGKSAIMDQDGLVTILKASSSGDRKP